MGELNVKKLDLFDSYIENFKEEFNKYLEEIAGLSGVKREDGYTCYVQDNVSIAEHIPKDKIVVDVGCSFGLQHVLYKDHKGYIGIQAFRKGLNCHDTFKPTFKVFTDNAKIIEGDFKDVWEQTGITDENKDQYFGIANHSLWHDPSANEEDIELFKKLFPNNNYATEESNAKVKF